jgi:hypothetical protein
MTLLSSDDRKRFASYCRVASESCRKIAEQLDKLNMPVGLVQRELQKSAAYSIVAIDLDRAESQTITSDEIFKE